MNYKKYIEENTIRCEASYRGGGIEIDLTELLKKDQDDQLKMTAYQNYLGGGMLGKICNSYSFEIEKLSKIDQKTITKITGALNRYFHDLTNHEGDEWEEATFEENQLRPKSAY